MSPYLIATLVVWACCFVLAAFIPFLNYYIKPGKRDTEDAATSAVQSVADGCAVFNVGFNADKMPLKEKRESLSKKQQKYFDGVLKYALAKNGAKLNESKNSLCVTMLNRPILRLRIRRKTTIASFKVKSEAMRDFIYNVETNNGIKEKETEIRIIDDKLFAAACDMVDFIIKQYRLDRH